MITVRNADMALSLSARASTADLQPGMIVVFVVSAASGDQPKVRKATNLEIADVTIPKGIVDFIVDDSEAVDFTINTVTQALTEVSNVIPINSQVNVWMGKLVIAYTAANLSATLAPATVREATKVAFDADTAFPREYLAGQTDGGQIPMGIVYRVDGPEVTLLITV